MIVQSLEMIRFMLGRPKKERSWNSRVRRASVKSVPRFAMFTDAQKDCV